MTWNNAHVVGREEIFGIAGGVSATGNKAWLFQRTRLPGTRSCQAIAQEPIAITIGAEELEREGYVTKSAKLGDKWEELPVPDVFVEAHQR